MRKTSSSAFEISEDGKSRPYRLSNPLEALVSSPDRLPWKKDRTVTIETGNDSLAGQMKSRTTRIMLHCDTLCLFSLALGKTRPQLKKREYF
jgi:hypothetical protein